MLSLSPSSLSHNYCYLKTRERSRDNQTSLIVWVEMNLILKRKQTPYFKLTIARVLVYKILMNDLTVCIYHSVIS